MKRTILMWVILAALTAGAAATIFVVADPTGVSITLRSDTKLTITSSKLLPVQTDPNSIDLVVRFRVQ